MMKIIYNPYVDSQAMYLVRIRKVCNKLFTYWHYMEANVSSYGCIGNINAPKSIAYCLQCG